MVRAASEVVSSPLSVPVGAIHQDAHTVGLVPSPSTRAISQRSEAFAAAFDSSARMFATAIPVSVNAVNGRVNQSTTVPPAVSVTWSGAVHPAAVFRDVGLHPGAAACPCFPVDAGGRTAEAVSVRYSTDPAGALSNEKFSVNVT